MNVSSSIADCYGAIEVFDYDNDSRVQFPGNYGTRDDFENSLLDFHEVNSIWLRLEPRLNGTFEFDIYTENNVDFAYALYKADDNTFCGKVESGHIEPVLYEEHSYHNKGVSSDGQGGLYKPSLKTTVEDVYYLVIHTNSTYKGKVRVAYRRIGKVERTASELQDFSDGRSPNKVRIKIRDGETGDPVEANMIVRGLKKDEYLFMETDFLFSATMEKDWFNTELEDIVRHCALRTLKRPLTR